MYLTKRLLKRYVKVLSTNKTYKNTVIGTKLATDFSNLRERLLVKLVT